MTIDSDKMFAATPKDKIKATFDATPGIQDISGDCCWPLAAQCHAQMPKTNADSTLIAFTTKEFPNIILELSVCSDPALAMNAVQAHAEGS